jgi:hypothetical protein
MKQRTRSQGSLRTSAAVSASPEDATPQADWREVSPVTQDAPGHVKRWLCHPRAEFFFWRDQAGAISAFQFCFEDAGKEHMVAWDAQRHAQVGQVDGGEASPLHNRSPIMKNQRHQASRVPQERWNAVKEGLPQGVATFVEGVLGWA